MRLLVALIAVTILAAPCAGSVADDPVLEKPVSLAVKGEALSDVLRILQSKSAAWLRVSRDVADQKVTVFVDGKPLRDVMSGLATLFGWSWRERTVNDHPVYELYEPSSLKKQRGSAAGPASDAAWTELMASLRRTYELTSKSREEIDQALRADVDDKLMADDEWRKMSVDYLASPRARAMFGFASTLPEGVIQALRSGATVYYDSQSPEEEWVLPEDLTNALVAERSEPIKPLSFETEAPIDLTDSIDEEDLSATEESMDEEDWGDQPDPEQIEDEWPDMPEFGETDTGSLPEPDHVRLELRASEGRDRLGLEYVAVFGAGEKRVGSWGNTVAAVSKSKVVATQPPRLPQKPDFEILTKKVKWTAAELVAEADLPKHRRSEFAFGDINRSDALAVLHRKLGLQVIADHYTNWRYLPEKPNPTLKDVLDELGQKNGPMGQDESDYESTWGADGQFIYFRVNDPPMADPWEVPNRLLRPWQKEYAEKHALDLDDYAQMALLSPEQCHTLCDCCARLKIGHPDTFGMSSYGFEGFGDSLIEQPVMRLYGLLSPRQRREAAAKGTPVAGFTADQRIVLDQLIARQRRKKGKAEEASVRVGVYAGDVRIDKPGDEPHDAPQPLTFQFRFAKSATEYLRDCVSRGRDQDGQEGESIITVTVKGTSFEQAWEKVKGKMAATDKHLLHRLTTQTYRAKVYFDDGTNVGAWPEINTRLTFDDYEADREQKKSSGP